MELKYRLGLLGLLCVLVMVMFFLKETPSQAQNMEVISEPTNTLSVTPVSLNE